MGVGCSENDPLKKRRFSKQVSPGMKLRVKSRQNRTFLDFKCSFFAVFGKLKISPRLLGVGSCFFLCGIISSIDTFISGEFLGSGH